MDFSFGKKLILDMVKEQQMKLGYEKETVRLYFPVDSLNNIIGLQNSATKEKRKEILQKFRMDLEETLGMVKITSIGEQFCIAISPEGCEYIHKKVVENNFLKEMIALFTQHNITIEDVEKLFKKYSNQYICKAQNGIEFDYLLYFEDKKIDEYYYCVKFDKEHASYHRFNEYDIKEILS